MCPELTGYSGIERTPSLRRISYTAFQRSCLEVTWRQVCVFLLPNSAIQCPALFWCQNNSISHSCCLPDCRSVGSCSSIQGGTVLVPERFMARTHSVHASMAFPEAREQVRSQLPLSSCLRGTGCPRGRADA